MNSFNSFSDELTKIAKAGPIPPGAKAMFISAPIGAAAGAIYAHLYNQGKKPKDQISLHKSILTGVAAATMIGRTIADSYVAQQGAKAFEKLEKTVNQQATVLKHHDNALHGVNKVLHGLAGALGGKAVG